MENTNNEYVTVSIHMKVDGKLVKMNEVNYQRGRETHCMTLDELAQILFMWERKFDSGAATHLMDGFLQEAEKKLPKKENETAQSVFEKYWINWKETLEEEFEKRNQGSNAKSSIWPEQNDYLAFETINLCRKLAESPKPIKYAFLYWFHKYLMNNSFEEYKNDIGNIPDFIKEVVDTKVVKNTNEQ